MAKKLILPIEIAQEIVNLYQGGLSTIKIGKQYKLSPMYVNKLLRFNDVHIKTYLEINRKHPVNDNYFSVINTEEKAYFLGFLFSDGNVSSKSNAITLKLQKKDKEILVRFSHIILNKEKLHDSENNYVLKFSSKSVKDDLIRHGCMPNKTFKITFPTIDPTLYNHFIRGYFDGDGSIYSYKTDYNLNIISTNVFCHSINQIIFDLFSIAGGVDQSVAGLKRGNTITSTVGYGGNRRVALIMDWLYKDATIYLERKHDKYLELKQLIKQVDDKCGNRYKRVRLDKHI